MSEKTIGYILLGVGIVLIVLALLRMFLVFTGKLPPVDLFHSNAISLDLGSLMPNAPAAAGNQELISADYLNLSSNLFIELLLMGFVASSGQKLASTGTSLLRPITVKLKAKNGVEYEAEKINGK